MRIIDCEPLSKHTTMRIGGLAKKFYVPESINELIKLLGELEDTNIHVISGGSNLLINDQRTFDHVISMAYVDQSIVVNDDGTVYCGASVRIQKLINDVKECNFGGIEYLYSLPAMVGGIICMNAGRGKQYHQSISDHVLEVNAIHNRELHTFKREECLFGYRSSIFQNSQYVIVGVKLSLLPKSKEEVNEDIGKRLELCKRTQDYSGGTFGTVFSEADGRVLNLMRKFFSHRNGVRYSSHRLNWMINDGNGTFKQAIKLISVCKLLHMLINEDVKEEVVIWE